MYITGFSQLLRFYTGQFLVGKGKGCFVEHLAASLASLPVRCQLHASPHFWNLLFALGLCLFCGPAAPRWRVALASRSEQASVSKTWSIENRDCDVFSIACFSEFKFIITPL